MKITIILPYIITPLLVVIVFSSSFALSAGAHHGDDEKVKGVSRSAQIVAYENNVYVIWKEVTRDGSLRDLIFRHSSDYGKSFDETINLTNGKGILPEAEIRVSKNFVYVAWEDMDELGEIPTIYFRKSSDFGKNFDEIINLDANISNNQERPVYGLIKMMQSDHDHLYVFMSEFTPETNQKRIIFRMSNDNGDTFGKPVVLFEFDEWYDYFDADAENGVIYAVADGDSQYGEPGKVLFKKISADDELGRTIQLNRQGSSIFGPQISVSEDNVYVIWREIIDGKHAMSFTKSNDGGKTFSKSVKLNTDPRSEVRWEVNSEIESGDNNSDSVYITWHEYNGKKQIFQQWIATSSDGGNSFQVNIHPLLEYKISESSIQTRLVEKDNNVYLLLADEKNPPFNDSVFYLTKSVNGGKTFSEVIEISAGTFKAVNPRIFADDKNLHITLEPFPKKRCIYYAASHDHGQSFSKIININPNGNQFECFGITDPIEPPPKQLKASIEPQDIECKKDRVMGYILALKERDGSPVCVTTKNYDNLIKRGWLAQDSHEILALRTAEKFMQSSPTFSSGGIPDSVELEISYVRKSIPPVVTIQGSFLSTNLGYGNRTVDELQDPVQHNFIIEVAQINKIHSAIIDGVWDEVMQDFVKNRQQEPLEEFHSAPTFKSVLTIGDRISESRLVPIMETEVSTGVIEEITRWTFQTIQFDPDNNIRKQSASLPESYRKFAILDENENDAVDRSKMPEHFGIPADSHGYAAICDGKERIVGESGHPTEYPIKPGITTVYATQSRGIYPDSEGIYTIKFVSLFATDVDFPEDVQVITYDTKLCPLENVREEATHVYYTKVAFKFVKVVD